MLSTIKNRVRYSPELSQAIGYLAAQQRAAYNAAVQFTLQHPNIEKNELQQKLTEWRKNKPERWRASVATQRPGLFRGRNAVRAADKATLNTLRETTKEVKLRNAPPKEGPAKRRNLPKHPVRPGRDPEPRRLFRSRKAPISLTIENSSRLTVIDRDTIRADGLLLPLGKAIREDTDLRAVQIKERKHSRRKGRNRPLRVRQYDVTLVVHTPDPPEKLPFDNPVGLDAGIIHHLTDSQGRHYDLPEQTLEKPAARIDLLKKRQKRLKRGGRRWTKLQKLLRKEYRRVSHIKDNWEHHTAKQLAENHSLVAVEDLRHRNMRASAKGTPENPGKNVRAKAGLNRRLSAARPGAIQQKLARHSEKNGTWFTKVPPKGTSQTCPLCGCRQKENRKSQAEFRCQGCRLEANADTTAAVNIRTTAVRALLLLTLLWAHGPEEAARLRRRPGRPPLDDSLILLSGRPGQKLDPSGTRYSGVDLGALGPTPFEPKLSLWTPGTSPG